MNEIKAPSCIMRCRKLMMKIGEHKMEATHNDEGTIADNEDIELRILELLFNCLPILYDWCSVFVA